MHSLGIQATPAMPKAFRMELEPTAFKLGYDVERNPTSGCDNWAVAIDTDPIYWVVLHEQR
jgi:hypothetical protein